MSEEQMVRIHKLVVFGVSAERFVAPNKTPRAGRKIRAKKYFMLVAGPLRNIFRHVRERHNASPLVQPRTSHLVPWRYHSRRSGAACIVLTRRAEMRSSLKRARPIRRRQTTNESGAWSKSMALFKYPLRRHACSQVQRLGRVRRSTREG